MSVVFLDQSELAARWRVSPRTLERWRRTGKGPAYVQVGVRILYRIADIERFEAAQTRSQLADRETRRPSAVGEAPCELPVPPGMPGHLVSDLPAAIAMPSEADEDPTYCSLFGPGCATVRELRAAVAALWKSSADDQRNAEALTQLLDLLTGVSAADDTLVSAALERANGRTA